MKMEVISTVINQGDFTGDKVTGKMGPEALTIVEVLLGLGVFAAARTAAISTNDRINL
jgi:hypothetical protein